jgi:hypothetical protein
MNVLPRAPNVTEPLQRRYGERKEDVLGGSQPVRAVVAADR